jgi:hypothetical protein
MTATITRPMSFHEFEVATGNTLRGVLNEDYTYRIGETHTTSTITHHDEVATSGPHLGDVDMGTLAYLLKAKGIHAEVYMTGGNCGGLYVGEPVDGLEGVKVEPVTCGPGTYTDITGSSMTCLHEFAVGLNWDVFGEDNDYTEVADTGATSHRKIAELIALYATGSVPSTDEVERIGLDGTLRSKPGWLALDEERIRQECDAANAKNRARIDQSAAALTYVTHPYDSLGG